MKLHAKIVGLIVTGLTLFVSSAQPQTQIDALSQATYSAANFDPNISIQEYLDSLTPEQKKNSDAYASGGYVIVVVDFVLSLFIAWIFLSFGLSAWIHKIASRSKRFQNLIYAVLYLFLAYLISFPLTLYTDFFREHQFGLSTMSMGSWLSETFIRLVLYLIAGGILISGLYFAMRKSQKNWWIIAGVGLFAFMVLVLFISPVFINPLFNEYKPLEKGEVRDEILSLAKGNGIPVDEVYQFNASKQSVAISANVSGIGSTIRISLNDNLLKNCTIQEIKAVMAHEMGHYVLNHVYKLLIYLGLVMFAGFALVNWLLKIVVRRFGAQWGFSSISDIRSLPLVVVLFTIYMFLATPVTNTIIRTTESEADIFGLNAAREPDGFASVSMKLSNYRKVDPGHFEEMILFDHPSGRTRVSMAMYWKAEYLK